MTRARTIHDCPYCGRTKFADETLPCCTDDLFAMRLEWQRQKDVRDGKRTEWVNALGQKMYADLTDEVGQ